MKSKRLLSVLVAAAMVAGSMPATVFAGRLDYEPEETEVTEITEPEEKENTSKAAKAVPAKGSSDSASSSAISSTSSLFLFSMVNSPLLFSRHTLFSPSYHPSLPASISVHSFSAVPVGPLPSDRWKAAS